LVQENGISDLFTLYCKEGDPLNTETIKGAQVIKILRDLDIVIEFNDPNKKQTRGVELAMNGRMVEIQTANMVIVKVCTNFKIS
jgi:hypothetical protein